MNTATAALNRRLLELAQRNEHPRCSDPVHHPLWTSDHEAERAEAARLCSGCPIIRECGAAADELDERFGVWSGRDRTVRPGRPKAKTMIN
jgi:hypothetical protein